MGELLERLSDAGALDDTEAALVRETRHDYRRATCLPESFIREFAAAQAEAYVAWEEAREESDFARYRPHLERMFDYARRVAEYIGYEGSPYNALLDEYERGMTAERLTPLFATLASRQKDLVARIMAAPQPDLAWTRRQWNEQAQWDFGMKVLEDMGYDLGAGRQDKSAHPFTTTFDVQDVRVTTRVHADQMFSALYSTLHEGGHALFEQGFRLSDRRTVLADSPSLGLHESQSRLWENVIGRSRPFWEHYAPQMKLLFREELRGITAEQLWRASNAVSPSLIRVEADEVTYNLHIIIRFELELAMLEGRMKVADLPEAWNAKYKEYLGIDVPDDANGCLQDVHWSGASIGYFPTYTLGNLYGAQMLERILADIPDLWERVGRGDLVTLREWLRVNVHQHGRRVTAPALIEQLTGRAPEPEPYLRYLETKYAELYNL
jgi:carboxypeptidase Taq